MFFNKLIFRCFLPFRSPFYQAEGRYSVLHFRWVEFGFMPVYPRGAETKWWKIWSRQYLILVPWNSAGISFSNCSKIYCVFNNFDSSFDSSWKIIVYVVVWYSFYTLFLMNHFPWFKSLDHIISQIETVSRRTEIEDSAFYSVMDKKGKNNKIHKKWHRWLYVYMCLCRSCGFIKIFLNAY